MQGAPPFNHDAPCMAPPSCARVQDPGLAPRAHGILEAERAELVALVRRDVAARPAEEDLAEPSFAPWRVCGTSESVLKHKRANQVATLSSGP